MSESHLCRYLEESASRFPERLAAATPDGARITYRELNEQADRIAGYLAANGVAPGDRVGLVLPKNISALTAIFGVLKARAAYVPVDWNSPSERARTILSDCAVGAVFLDHKRTDLADTASTVIWLGEGDGAGVTWETALEHEPLASNAAQRRASDLAYILYTSGSTGVPKGVMLSHENATSYVDWCTEIFAPSEHDRFSSHAPFHFDLSILDIYVPIKHRASVHLIPDELGKSPKDLARFIGSSAITVWYSTPAILGALAEFGNLDKLDCSSLRLVLFAGEVFPVKQLRQLVSRWPHPRYYNLYGPTETNVCTYAEIPNRIPEDRTAPYPIGWPCSHCEAMILDEGQPVNEGEEGLLYIAGPSVFSAYWGRPVETAAAFVERGGKRWYNTGDVVRQDARDGLIYAGRRDRMVKRLGYRIELGEIESCLYRHPAVAEAAAIAVTNPQTGTRIVCYIAAPEEKRPSIIELKVFCNRHLPSYMNPDTFVFAEVLPRTSTNKVDYQGLMRSFEMAEQAAVHAS